MIKVENLSISYFGRGFLNKKAIKPAVNNVSFSLRKGIATGLVGESGSGKTSIGRALLRLIKCQGKFIFEDQDLFLLTDSEFKYFRRKIQMVFQDPHSSFDPRWSLKDILFEPLDIHFPKLTKIEKMELSRKYLSKVAINPDWLTRYPHELSGGQKQRLSIARALMVSPEFLILDEAVSALDVSVQAEIINLLKDLQSELGMTYLFISHDLAVVENICEDVLVLNQGNLVEAGPCEGVFGAPTNEYTKKLINSLPHFRF